MKIINKIRGLIERTNKENTTFLSFLDPLKQLCIIQKPDSILEFGPGYSTRIFLDYTKANIESIEENFRWFLQYKLTYNNIRLKIIYKQPQEDLSVLPPISTNSPLVFIDGSDRLAVLKWVFNILPEGGSVYLHDAHREDYEPGVRLYPFIFFPERHSAILSKQEYLYDQIRANIKVDYSCSCQYCSAPARRAYFNQFVKKDIG